MKFPKLFSSLKKLRQFERVQLPFIRSLIDFDIIIEIGYAQESRASLTPKQLFLLEVGSVSTVRRRLAILTSKGVISRQSNTKDHRSELLTLSPASLKLFERYGLLMAGILETGR
jgi:DNA-binding MarR family transcriptional regulator